MKNIKKRPIKTVRKQKSTPRCSMNEGEGGLTRARGLKRNLEKKGKNSYGRGGKDGDPQRRGWGRLPLNAESGKS